MDESVCRAEPRCEDRTAAGQGKGRSWRARWASGRIGAPAVFHVADVPASAGRPSAAGSGPMPFTRCPRVRGQTREPM